MAGAIRRLAAAGVPLPLAVRAASEAPAALAGLPGLARLCAGAPASLVVLDGRLEVVRVLCEGRDVR
jgi:N-acetylglucosamine-6-phosphate deacetylase